MAKMVPSSADPFVVELGAGTGPVTQALVDSGLSPGQLMIIEMSNELGTGLKQRFPNQQVVIGDAAELDQIIGKDKVGRVNAIVSSLPLITIPNDTRAAIIEQMKACLAPDGVIIQFTYDPRLSKSLLVAHFKHIKSKTVWLNIPPARVDMFARLDS